MSGFDPRVSEYEKDFDLGAGKTGREEFVYFMNLDMYYNGVAWQEKRKCCDNCAFCHVAINGKKEKPTDKEPSCCELGTWLTSNEKESGRYRYFFSCDLIYHVTKWAHSCIGCYFCEKNTCLRSGHKVGANQGRSYRRIREAYVPKFGDPRANLHLHTTQRKILNPQRRIDDFIVVV